MPYRVICLSLLLLYISSSVFAGPPYDTDDPQPVDLHHLEMYCSTQIISTGNTQFGALPLVEGNYGAAPNLQLHAMVQLYLFKEGNVTPNYGFGDLELGAKYRLVKEDTGGICPQISIYPAVEIPTGNANEGLGNGIAQYYLPVWIEKTFGKWTANTGAAYWINPGQGNKNYGFFGLQGQYQVFKNVSFGAELNYITASQMNSANPDVAIIPANTVNDLRFNIGTVIDFNDYHHLLISVGRSITGKVNFESYIGYQLTI